MHAQNLITECPRVLALSTLRRPTACAILEPCGDGWDLNPALYTDSEKSSAPYFYAVSVYQQRRGKSHIEPIMVFQIGYVSRNLR